MLCRSLCCALFSLSLPLWTSMFVYLLCLCLCGCRRSLSASVSLCMCVCVCSFVCTFVWRSLAECERESARSLSQVHFFLLLCLGKNESKAEQITKKRRICCASHAARFCFGLRAALFISSGGASTALPIVCRCIGMRARRSRSRRRRCVCFCV